MKIILDNMKIMSIIYSVDSIHSTLYTYTHIHIHITVCV